MIGQVEHRHVGSAVGGRARTRAGATLAVLLALASVALLALTPAPASAAQRHAFSHGFGSPGSGNGQLALSANSGVAVNNATHDVYVADSGNGRVEQFEADGTFVRTFGSLTEPTFVAIDNSGGLSNGDVYVADSATDVVSKFEADGTLVSGWGSGGHLNGSSAPGGLFGEIFGIAVNSSGELFVLSEGTRMSTFEPAGAFLTEFSLAFPASSRGIALDNSGGPSGGDIYAVYQGEIETLKFDPAGNLLGEPDLNHGTGLAVDSSNGDLYVGHSPTVSAYGPSGSALETFGSAEPGGGELQVPTGLAIDASDHTVYVADKGNQRIDAFASVSLPGVSTGPVSNVQAEAATLNATLNPAGTTPDTEVSACQLEYVKDATFQELKGSLTPDEIFASFGAASPCLNPGGSATAPLAPDTADHPVHADLTGLQAGTAYDFRLAATNANGTEASSPKTFSTLFPLIPPTIESISATAVSSTAASLQAAVNPNHYATSYHFEYVDDATYELDLASGDGFQHASRSPLGPDAVLSPSGVTQSVSQQLQGLRPETTYRYRLLAGNGNGGPQASAVGAFTTQGTSPASLLPDGRAWELVSPPDKNGIPLEAIASEGADIQAAADGSGLAYAAKGAIDSQPAGNRSAAISQLLAHRTATGWSTVDVATPHELPDGVIAGRLSEYKLFSTDLSRAAVEPEGPFTPLSAQASEYTPYLRQPGGEYTPIVSGCPPPGEPCDSTIAAHANVPPGTKFGGVETVPGAFANRVQFVSATPDLSHLIVATTVPLTAGFTGSLESVYEWSAGALALISQVPPEGATSCGAVGPPACIAAAEVGLNASLGREGNRGNLRQAISSDGNRMVFETQNEEGRHLFLRDVAGAETIQLDAPQSGAAGGRGAPAFQTASTDGSKIFFTDPSRLTVDSTAEPESGKPDLYMCEIAEVSGHLACTLKDLTVNAIEPAEPADVQGFVLGASEDGSAIYFVANGALTAGEGAAHGDCIAEPAGNVPPTRSCNLYRYDTDAGVAKLVAVLSNRDSPDWFAKAIGNLSEMTARVSPDGRWLTFSSQRPLTGYDNRDASPGAYEYTEIAAGQFESIPGSNGAPLPAHDQEVFLYHASPAAGQASALRCVSCNPTGARPRGIFDTGKVEPATAPLVDRPGFWQGQWIAASIPGWTAVDKAHALYQSRFLSNSGRLLFNANDALVPQDSNGTEDVYQYEPPQGADQPPSDSCTAALATYSPHSGGCVSLISAGTSPEESAFLDASENGDDVFFLTASRLAPTDVDNALDVYDAHVCSAAAPCPPPPAPAAPECEGDACQPPATPPGHPTPGTALLNGPGNVLECHKGKVKQIGKCVAKKSSKHKHHKKSKKRHAKVNRGGAK